MESLTELCDLIAQNPVAFGDKLAWLCSRCPQAGSQRLSRSHLHALLATARFLSKSYGKGAGPGGNGQKSPIPENVVLSFFGSVSFHPSFFPASLSVDNVASFFADLLDYVSTATELSPEFAAAVGPLVSEVLATALGNAGESSPEIARAFLFAVARHCPPLPPAQVDRLLSSLLDHFVSAADESLTSPRETSSSGLSASAMMSMQSNSDSSPRSDGGDGSVTSSAATTPSSKGKGKEKHRDSATTDDEVSSKRLSNGNGGLAGRSSLDQLGMPFGSNDGAAQLRQNVVAFEEESIEGLEKQEVAFKLFAHILDKSQVKSGYLKQIRSVTEKQLRSLPAFLKIRKRDWREQGPQLKTRINAKLSACQSATVVQVKSLLSLDSDGKDAKMLLRGTLALLLDAAEACILSSWRKLKICEELFSSLLSGIAQVVVTRGGQLLRVLLMRLKLLVLTTCAQADTWGSNLGAMFESVAKTSCEIIEFGWSKDRAPVDTFIMGLASSIRERNDYEEQDEKEKPTVPVMQLNVIRLLADISASVKKWEVVDMILPLFIESLEEGDASSPSQLRLRLLDAVSHMAGLGFEKSYRETVVLMTRSYLSKLSTVGSVESKTSPPEATTERVETLPAGFLRVASCLESTKLRSDYRHRLLSLCSDVGLAAESKSGRSGADFLGPLLPAVAEICKDFDPTSDVEPSLLKLFRNLWFYIVLFGLAPPIQSTQPPTKSVSTSLNSLGSMSAVALQAVAGPYMWNTQWSVAVQRIAQGTPPLVVSSVKWLEDELELNALHNPGSRRGSGNEKAAVAQRAALSAALGGRVEVAAMGPISGVKSTYLLAVAFLEIIRFSINGGIINRESNLTSSSSAFSCVFEYLKTPNLLPVVFQCLTAIVHRAFETAVEWLDERLSEIGNEAVIWDSILIAHACFLIKCISQREEHIRDLSVSVLNQLKHKYPQVLWNSSCLDLLFSVNSDSTSMLDPAWVATVRSLHQKIVREWITNALSLAPLAASGANLKVLEAFNLEVLSTSLVSATVKSNHSGEIAGMKRLYTSIGGFQTGTAPRGFGLGFGLQSLTGGGAHQQAPENETFSEILLSRFMRSLQQFVNFAEKGGVVDKAQFREICSQATAFLLSILESNPKSNLEGFSQLLRLLCWCPAYISTPEAMETGVFIWTWLVSAAPQLGSLVLAELVDAWLWTIDTKRGLFAYDMKYSGPAAKLRPQLTPGEPEVPPEKDPVEGIIAHRLWLGFFIDRFEVVRHDSVEQLLLLGRMLKGTTRSPTHFTRHPAAVGTFFTVMLLGLKFCNCQSDHISKHSKTGLQLLEDRVFRASLCWFSHEPEWYDASSKSFAQSEAQSVSVFVHLLMNGRVDAPQSDSSKARNRENESTAANMTDQYHPVWGYLENYATGREKRKQLLLMLCQNEADRLDVWANPVNCKELTGSRLKINSEKWIDYVRTAFSVDPRIALSLATRFPAVPALKAEVTQLVQRHILELRNFPEALPFFVAPKAVDENSVLLQQLPHWAACSITQALEFLTPSYKGHPRVMAYVLRVLESYPPERVTFFMPQLVQALRYDEGKLVEGYLLGAALRSNIFAHILIWHLQGETFSPEPGKDGNGAKISSFQALLPVFRQRIIDSFSPEAREMFQREFDFFDKVTSISGVLFPLPKEERRAGIRRELEKIEVTGNDLYLPTAPNRIVQSIRLDSGIPLQSAAKVPIMITFNVADREGNPLDIRPQACIFKVGDDCRQDVLALQVIALLKDIFDAVGLNLYLFPYGVLPTGPERGIIEVVPNTRSRSQMGETTDGGLYEIFQQDFGPVGSSSFEAARDNFIISSAGYAVASLLLQPKDRHNGNLLFDNVGRLVHIDFGFILETSPGGNMRFESAHFKLSHEMTQLLDPSGMMKSDTWYQFVSLCVKGYLAVRRYMDGIINTVMLMVDSGLPCFSRGDPIGNLRKRFHPEMSEREAANFMIRTCTDAYNKWSTAGYDLIQYIQQGIEK
ncbi:phosphatidylinositol 4-kinase alpha 1-like isoform X2 [Aristolochia californica]|uniref:phosphatidylinositol 4-kinase alpha 1-like isoform X2 n=1 Tax=Aristolochia californica TaxID=171875 RepID=UPI0035D8E6F8